MPCPYRDPHGICDLGFSLGCSWQAFKSCPHYARERKRLRAVVGVCRHARRRRWPGGIDARSWRYDHWVWCHRGVGTPQGARDEKPSECWFWPGECPKRLVDRIKELEAEAARARLHSRVCPYCRQAFLAKDPRRLYCSTPCKNAWTSRRRRRRDGVPEHACADKYRATAIRKRRKEAAR